MNRTRSSKSFGLVCALLLALVAGAGYAQTGAGTVTGTVQDPQKAVLRNATVTLTNTATNVARKATTNEEGVYYFGSVPRGAYTMVIETAGFKKWEGKLELQVGQNMV